MVTMKSRQIVTDAVKKLMRKKNATGYKLEQDGFVKIKYRPYKRYSGGVSKATLTKKGIKALLRKK